MRASSRLLVSSAATGSRGVTRPSLQQWSKQFPKWMRWPQLSLRPFFEAHFGTMKTRKVKVLRARPRRPSVPLESTKVSSARRKKGPSPAVKALVVGRSTPRSVVPSSSSSAIHDGLPPSKTFAYAAFHDCMRGFCVDHMSGVPRKYLERYWAQLTNSQKRHFLALTRPNQS